MASSVQAASSLPARQSRFLAAAPGTTVQLTGVLDGHGLADVWVTIGTATDVPATYADFVTTGVEDQLVDVDSIAARTVAGTVHFTATIPGAIVGGSPANVVYAALFSHVSGSPNPSGTDAPFAAAQVGQVGAPV